MKTALTITGFLLAASCSVFLYRLNKRHGELWFDFDLSMGAINGDMRDVKERLRKLESKAGRTNAKTKRGTR